MSCEILSNSKITDKDFLVVMIKHHTEAVNMSRLVLNISEDDNILDYARRSIYNQENQIHLMERLSKNIPNLQSGKSCNCGNKILTNNIDYGYPNIFSNIPCNQDTFASLITPNSNYKLVDSTASPTPTTTPYATATLTTSASATITSSTSMPILTDTDYITHMVSHHKTGIELSKLAIRSTTEPKILNLAQTILLEQEKEMFILVNLNNCIKYNWRKIIKQ